MKAETVSPTQENAPESSGVFGNLWSSRKLMVVGVLLGSLLVIHLLVNMWLLILLCASLVVLGGWLGSNAIAGASGQLHLERFITVNACPPCPEAERQLEREINCTIQMIIRDFVLSWYRSVSQEPAFEAEMEAAMKGLVQELRRRISRVDSHALTQKVLTLCGCHLQSYIQAKEATAREQSYSGQPSQLWDAYCQATTPHPAMHSPTTEITYARGIVNLLFQELVPKPHLETRTGRHVVVELVTCNVILPLINKLSDPDWIHIILVSIFSKYRHDTAQGTKPPCSASVLEQSSVPTSLPLIVEVESLPIGKVPPSPVSAPVHITCSEPAPSPEVEEGHEAVEGDLTEMLEERKVGNNAPHFLQPDIRGPLFLCEDSELESPLSELGKETIMLMTPGNFLSDRIQDALCALEDSRTLEPKDGEGSEGMEGAEAEEAPGTDTDTGLLVSMLNCPEIQIDTADKDVEQEQVTPLTALPEEPENSCPPRPSCLEKDLTSGVSSLDPTLPPVPLSSSPPGPLSSATFSFEPLSSPDGPVVIQNLRITGTITAREHSGTGFHPYTLYTVKYETALNAENSSSLQQLAYHTVNRRYREFLNLQTRLEEKPDLRKFIKNIKGPKKLFPDLPFGNMDSDRVEARKSLLESFLKQLCAIPEIANSEEVQEFLALNTDARIAFVKKPFMVSRIDKESEILSMFGMESFIEKQTKLLEMQPAEVPDKDPQQVPKECVDSCLLDTDIAQELKNSDPGTETELADTALDLILLLLMEQWTWLCTESMQKFLRLIFGTLVQRWLEVQVANLTCPQRWVQYLRLLRESIWPGGVLPKYPRPGRTQAQKAATEKQALQSLMSILPEFLVEILGVNKCQLSWSLVLESFQQPLINRHLIYCLGDIILEFLDLGASVEEPAPATSASDSPSSLKRMAVST
ncbi:sorting nexin-19 isoform X3 [Cricetulus griseus]|uniref:Sorting nexin-19 n=1 Tax=Cricetulus griseus TaxID=10029 RepID=A0A9J7K7V7_CRIGR|nr:sorting nexin-19 isoform X3 [Cricetulus griseus]ERE77023.1 sorting nexin-19-like protein [Cricetulus griseus]